MNTNQLNITEYARFRHYLQQLRSADYPLGRFLTLLLELPRRVVRSHLLKASYDESLEIRCEVVPLAARLIPMEAGVRTIELLLDLEPPVRIVALNALAYLELPCESSVVRLLEYEANGDVRYAAVSTLGVIGTERCLSALESIVTSDPMSDYEGRSVAERAQAAIKMVEERRAQLS